MVTRECRVCLCMTSAIAPAAGGPQSFHLQRGPRVPLTGAIFLFHSYLLYVTSFPSKNRLPIRSETPRIHRTMENNHFTGNCCRAPECYTNPTVVLDVNCITSAFVNAFQQTVGHILRRSPKNPTFESLIELPEAQARLRQVWGVRKRVSEKTRVSPRDPSLRIARRLSWSRTHNGRATYASSLPRQRG